MQTRPRCAECGGTLRTRSITHTQAWGGKLSRVENVPARVCVQCGEVWLAGEVSQKIDRILRSPPKAKKYLQVPVFSFSEEAIPGRGSVV